MHGKKGNYHVNASESGIIRLPLYSETDVQFDRYLKQEKGITDRDDVQLILSGKGLLNVYDFVANKLNAPGSSSLSLEQSQRPEEI